MDGDEYVPQISQMNYNLMNDMPTGNSSFYDQQQQQVSSIGAVPMYGSSGVLQGATSSVSNIPQQRYTNYHRQQQMIQGGPQPSIVLPATQQQQQQQRFFMQQQHQMQPNIMSQHSMQPPMFSPIINVPPVIDMNSMPNKMASHPIQSASQPSSSVITPLNSPVKTKNTRKSKKAIAAAAATVETAATTNSNNSNVTDPRDFSVPTQQMLPASYQPGFHPNNFQQHPMAIQQQQRLYAGNMYLQQQQQQQPWHTDSATASASFSPMAPSVGGHHSQMSVQQPFQQPQGIPVSSSTNNTFSSPYHNSALPNQQQQTMNNYYGQLKNTPTYFDQQSSYEMHYGNGSSGMQAQARFPQMPYFDPSSSVPPTSNTPAINSMHPYYSQQQSQQQQQQFPQNYGPLQQQIVINTKPNLQQQQQQQYPIPSALQSQHPGVMQHSPQIKASTSTGSAVQNPATSTHVQTSNQMLPQTIDASTSSTHWQSQQLNQTSQPLNVSPYYAQAQPVIPQQQVAGHHPPTHQGYPHQGYPHQQVSMISPQQQQQIQFEQHQLQQEMFECERQIALCYQQQQRTPEINQRIEQFQQRIQFLRSRFIQLQQQQTFLTNSSEQHKSMISQPPQSVLQQQPINMHTQQTHIMEPNLTITPKYSSSSAAPASLTSPGVSKKFSDNNVNTTTVSSRGTTPAPSVSVFPSGTNQVQVSITPESTGRTLISVYHQKYIAASPLSEQSNTAVSHSSNNLNSNEYSVPPEPVPPKKQRVNSTHDEFSMNQNLISNKICSSQTKLFNKEKEISELHDSPPPAPEIAKSNQTVAVTSELSAQNNYNVKTNTYRLNSVTSTSIITSSTLQSSLTTVASSIPETKLCSSKNIFEKSNETDDLIQNNTVSSDKGHNSFNEVLNENCSIVEFQFKEKSSEIINKLDKVEITKNIEENIETESYKPDELEINDKKVENFKENNTLESSLDTLQNNILGNVVTDNILKDKTDVIENNSQFIVQKDNINFPQNDTENIETKIEMGISNVTTEDNTFQHIKIQNYSNIESTEVLENSFESDNNNESCTKSNIVNNNESFASVTNQEYISSYSYVISENDENVESNFNDEETIITNKQDDVCGNIEQHHSVEKETVNNLFDKEKNENVNMFEVEEVKEKTPVMDDDEFLPTAKRKGRKQKKQPIKVEFIKNDLVEYKRNETKKKRSVAIKPLISKKRKRLDNSDLGWSREDQEDSDFIISSKKRKISTFSKVVVSNDFEEENFDAFVEKRRSGRKKVEKQYGDRDIEAELDLELENNVDASKNNLGDANNNDTASQSNQDEWIVEKILGMRLAKKTIKKTETGSEQAIQQAKLVENDENSVLTNSNEIFYNDETLNNKEIESDLLIEVKNCIDEIINILIKNEKKIENNVAITEIIEESEEKTEILNQKKHQKDSNSFLKKIKEKKKKEVLDDTLLEEKEQFYIKYKNRSYMHCDWKFSDELEILDKRAICKINRYKQKFPCEAINDEEYFNDDYVIVDRVLNDYFDENEKEGYAFVKWRSLCYGECTWELAKNVPKLKIEESRKRNNEVDSFKLKERQRPSIHEWKKITIDKRFKDGNTLREYQVEGVNWLLFCYLNQQNCILADEMGLGKTVQTITFLQGLYDLGIHGPFLIVVPLSTLHNWEREFETWTDMNAVVYHGSAASREIIQNYELYYSKDTKTDSKKKQIVKFDALITTFEMVVSDCETLRKINYRVCVIDEAHRLKNRNCKLLTGGLLSFKMEHRVLLTGTPLQNNIQELFSLLNFLEPEQFSSSESFLEQFGQCQTEEQVQKLQEILKPMMLRRLKEDVEKTLQPKEETIIEVQLSNIQKKYYRAILERNFTHLLKGGSVPSLMNTMMELRKCCNHPFLINGAEEQILSEVKLMNSFKSEDEVQLLGLIQSSGKMVLIDKLLPKLRQDGHKVLIFSQMVRVLDILEEFLIYMNYPFERIDGNVRGDLRQAAIDRFSKQDSERFVFLLCTRAGGLGINLTAADTVIIFDSDWNPQNDLQAQARCHRIGQKKMVKVYRLITSNTYEREMFDKASLKLGLDKAVLQSMTPKENSQQLSRKEVEDLLRKGAYGAVMDEDNEGSKFSEEDIETILQRRTQTIRLEPGVKGSTFAKASFTSSSNREDIDVNDPNFWSKWAKKANIDMDSVLNKTNVKSNVNESLIVLEPRSRRKRFEENYKTTESAEEDTAGASIDDDSESVNGTNATAEKNKVVGDSIPYPSKVSRSAKKRRRAGLTLASEDGDEDYVNNGYTPNELAFNKSEFFKVEKLLGIWGWGRWSLIKQKTDISLSENDMEHISRTLLLHCIREFRGDDKIRDFVWNLIIPRGGIVGKNSLDTSNLSGGIYHQGWAALPEYNPPAFAVDSSFQRHVHRHANKLLARIHHLQILQKNIIDDQCNDILEDKIDHNNIQIRVPAVGDPPSAEWDFNCDKSFLIGVFKHGMENFDAMRNDSKLCFLEKNIGEAPTTLELNTRFKRLISMYQRKAESSAAALVPKIVKWPKVEEADYMRVLRMYGVKDDNNSANVINWVQYRELSTNLHKKTDAEMLEQLYCVLAMCTKQQGGELSAIDQKRASCVEPISRKRAEVLMNRIHLMRKIHAIITTGIQNVRSSLKICSVSAMPKGWSETHDENLLIVVDKFGLDNITSKLKLLPLFQKLNDLDEKIMLRRIVEICTTLETGKWNGNSTTELIEDEPNLSAQKSSNLIAEENRASSGSPVSTSNVIRNKSRKRVSISQQGLSSETQKGSDSKPSGTANITSVTTLDLGNLEKEKKKLLQQQDAFFKALDQSAGIQNYMLTMLGLGALDCPTSSKKSNSTSSSNNSLSNSAAAALQALLGMSSLGATDATTASALSSLFAGVPLNALMSSIGMPSNSKSSSSFLNMFKSNGGDVLNLTKKKTSNANSLNLNTSTSGKSSSNKANTSKNSSSTQNITNDLKSNALNSALSNNLANLGQVSISELLTASRWPAETPVPMINIETGTSLATDKLPKLKNLDQWLLTHQKYTVDIATLMLILASSTTTIPTNSSTNRSKSVSNKESAQCTALGNQKSSSNNSANSNALKNLSKTRLVSPTTSNIASTVSTSRSSTEASSTKSNTNTSSNYTNIPSTSKLSNTTTAFSLENSLQIPVVHKNTGALLPMEKWPLLTNLSTWLDKNPDYNVQQNHALLVKGLLSKAYHNRIGSESTSSTANTTTISTNITTSTTTTTTATNASSASTSSLSSSTAATQLIQSLAASMLPSINSSLSDSTNATTAAISKLFSGASSSLNTTSSSSNSNSAANFLNSSSNLSQNMEQLQMQFLLQQLMIPSSLTYPYASFLSSNGASTSTTASSSNTNAGNNNTSTTAANNLAASLGLCNFNNSNNNSLSNDSLAAAAVLMGVSGSNSLDAATTNLLAQALLAPSTTTKTQQSNSLNSSSSSKKQSLLAYNSALGGSGGQGNNAASNFLAETALAAEIVTNPTLLTSMLNPLASLGLSNNNNSNSSISAALAAAFPFLTGSTSNSTNSLDAATMAMAAAATLGGIDPAIVAALSGSNSNLPSNNKLPTTSVSRKNTSTSTSISSNPSSTTHRNSRSGLLNAVVEKLSNSSSAANGTENLTNKNSTTATTSNSNSNSINES